MTAAGPDEKILRSHLDQGAFQSGVDRDRWRLVSIDWPIVVIAVTGAERAGAPNEFVFRFDLSDKRQEQQRANYPMSRNRDRT